MFDLQSEFKPSYDQSKAIEKISSDLDRGKKDNVLLGVTGSGKTFVMANVIRNLSRPVLVMTHNKTLTAQLFGEFKSFFPNNAVEYFVSYYDYYQPEAYVPNRDVYIEKETSINDDLDKLRLSATRSLFEREDVVIVSSVSCIYGLGSPEAYSGMMLFFKLGDEVPRRKVFKKLVEIQYVRNDLDFHRGTYRVRGETVDIFPAYEDHACRIEFFGDEIESIVLFDPLTGKKLQSLTKFVLYPASHYVQPKDTMSETLRLIEEELKERYDWFKTRDKPVEAERIRQRTQYDMEMLEETGVCPGIENYSRIMTRRKPGQAPPTLFDYFPKDSLLFLDESHVTLPQVGGMFNGDLSRKRNLVDFGFRLPSALDNRPLKFEEFEQGILRTTYVSATPGDYELNKVNRKTVELLTRPTGLVDPAIAVRPTAGQVDDMYGEIVVRAERSERILITTLTKRMAEDLTDYYQDLGVRVRYLHSEIDAIERTEIIRKLRLGEFDVLIGINLLREGLDIPEVSLVGIFDADKEGFLRSYRSLLQTSGRAARNVEGRVIMYADVVTESMARTISETRRRRKIQQDYNEKHGIVPVSVHKEIRGSLAVSSPKSLRAGEEGEAYDPANPQSIANKIRELEKEMRKEAKKLNFERASELRDELRYFKNLDLGVVE